MSNSIGKFFKVTSFGESHGDAIGVVIDGCPGRVSINIELIQQALDRRRPGQSSLVTTRNEKDKVLCLSGIEDGFSLGGPICFIVKNKDKKQSDYDSLLNIYRPSHADFTTQIKYGIRAKSGGGRASARETIARVIAGSVAQQFLQDRVPQLEVLTYVSSVKNIHINNLDHESLSIAEIESHPTRCPDRSVQAKMQKLIEEARSKGDSVGGSIVSLIRNPPPALGEPVFDKLEADLAKAVMSIPAVRGFELGLGFASTLLWGSENNDPFVAKDGKIITTSNNSGGIQGGISNGQNILLRAALKPTSTIQKVQNTVNEKGENISFQLKSGRHDPCVLPRAVPIIEAMVYLVIVDHYLRQYGTATQKK